MIDSKYGKRFKQLRLQKNFSLDNASIGITSKSSLYYWEKGQRNMPFDKVVAMLNRMRIPSEELYFGLNDEYQYMIEISDAYLENDKQKLKHLAIISLKQLRESSQDKNLLIKAAISCNFLKYSTNELLFSPKNLANLEELLSEIKEWNFEDIFNFGNTLSLLPNKRIFGLAKLLIRVYLENKPKNYFKWEHAALNTIFNASVILIMNDCKYSSKLISELKLLKIDDIFAFEKIRLTFISELVNYSETTDDTEIINHFFPIIEYLGFADLSMEMKKAFVKVKKIVEERTKKNKII
ncbi:MULTISPECIES: helix-turn-helix domain-containing protein [unclassified Lactobacillus]|uniref:helix-turn-helix domain-containing protein n=1 Tax=unclassified Lactobacillus TaxID=2620435 RepID=UPI00226A7B59|nr:MULTISPECIES: Rgg/GadR/MutR family transcriptional regulator [unclassified Lactobacillus]MCX8721657.1 hypothetical protein [Lactobacillus sp. B4010]MCX8731338.1 hypothetical protein [Lactobacillus sp. B4015]MCX8733559.1 hypothetical protein [Lactobacillus sp. B4012]